MGGGPYLELFARHRQAGWEVALSPEADTGRASGAGAPTAFQTLEEKVTNA